MKKFAAVAACAVMIMSFAAGCTKSSNDIETETATETGLETAAETETETETAAVTETETETENATETETETEKAAETEAESDEESETEQDTMVEYDSDFGYHITYDKSLFSVNGSSGYDELDLKGQSFSNKPLVFFAATQVKNDQIADILEETFGDDAQETSIGVDKYKAISLPTTEHWDKGNGYTYHNQYIVALANGDALMFEIQWYSSDDDENNYSQVLTDLLDSLVIDLPVQSGQVIEETNYAEGETETETETISETETAEK